MYYREFNVFNLMANTRKRKRAEGTFVHEVGRLFNSVERLVTGTATCSRVVQTWESIVRKAPVPIRWLQIMIHGVEKCVCNHPNHIFITDLRNLLDPYYDLVNGIPFRQLWREICLLPDRPLRKELFARLFRAVQAPVHFDPLPLGRMNVDATDILARHLGAVLDIGPFAHAVGRSLVFEEELNPEWIAEVDMLKAHSILQSWDVAGYAPPIGCFPATTVMVAANRTRRDATTDVLVCRCYQTV